MEHATFSLAVEGDEIAHRTRASYDADIHAWALQQAGAIRLGRFHELDVENSADEVEGVAKRERRIVESRLSRVFHHSLELDIQPARRSASWARAIDEQRRRVDRLLDGSPSMGPQLPTLSDEAFQQGRVAALNETGLPESAVSRANPYSWDDLMRRPVAWPET